MHLSGKNMRTKSIKIRMQILIYFVRDGSYCLVPTQPPTSSSLGKTAGAQSWQARPDVCRNMFFFSPTEWRNKKESKKEERGNAQNVRLSAWKATHMQNALLEVQCLTTHHIMQTQYRGRYRGRSGGKGGRARNEKMRRIQHVVRVCFQYTESWLMTLPYTTSWRQVHRILLTICFLFFFFKAVGSSTSDQKLRLLTGSFN